MSNLPNAIPDFPMGRDKRFINKGHDDEFLDLQLYRWALNNDHSYFEALGRAIQSWLLVYLKDLGQYRWQMDKLSVCAKCILYRESIAIFESLPLRQWGFPTPTQKSALQHVVKRFLKAQGVSE